MLRRSKLAVPVLVLLLASASPALARSSSDDIIPGSYIVTYKSTVTSVSGATAARERRDGFKARFLYSHAIRGFAARLSDAQVRRLEADSAVASVEPDRRVRASAETFPTGIQRIRASIAGSVNAASRVNVAVIDTGVDLSHPDLNVVSGTDCVSPGTTADDENGHGTHVAGTIAAKNNGSGVVGVVPGTTVYAVRVLDARGSGTWSQVICGVNWVTANASADNIRVANMSLGGGGSSSDMSPCGSTTSFHQAICNSTAAGVAYAVAAGNSGWDFDYAPAPDVPAAYPEVVTAAAMSDSDGQPGGTGGAPSCRTGEQDDRYASFSNWAGTSGGRAHTLAAPGVCILSDWMGGGTNTISGTSMATPHVTGTIAHCDGDLGGAAGPCAGITSPTSLIPKITYTDASYGFFGDPNQPVSGEYFGYESLAGPAPPTAPAPSPGADFTLSASPPGQSVSRGGTTSYSVTITPTNGFGGSVNLTVSGVPKRTSASFSPNPATTSSTLTVKPNTRAPTGTYTLTITGTSGSLTHSTSVTLTVR